MTPTILITRPDPAGAEFADRIRQRLGCGIEVVVSPIMCIEYHGTLPDLEGVRALVFTSRNGVLAYAQACHRRDIRCYCVGDATARLAQEHGLTAISSSGAADDLVACIVSDRVDGPCLHVRGEQSVGGVAARLSVAGIPTQEAVLYRQVPQSLSEAAKRLLRGKSHVILPLFSPRSAELMFASNVMANDLIVVALSANVAAALPEGFDGELIVAERPDAEAMLDTLQEVVERGKALEA